MENFLSSSAEQMWPYYLLALCVGELLLWLKQKNGLSSEVIVASLLCVLLTILSLVLTRNLWMVDNRPVFVAAVYFLSILMPISVFVVANQVLSKITRPILMHTGLLGVVLLVMLIWPLWALTVTCASGLDCL